MKMMKNDEKIAIIVMLIHSAYKALPPGYNLVSIDRTKDNMLNYLDFNWIEYIIKNLESENLIEYIGMGINPGKNTSYSMVVKPDFLDWYKKYKDKHATIFNKLKVYNINPRTNLSVVNATADKTYRFDNNLNTLYVGNKPVKFKRDTRKFTLLKVLMRKPKGFYYSEVVKDVEGADGIDDPKNTYYEVCRGISISLAKIGITDFIVYDFNQAKINPLYKKAS